MFNNQRYATRGITEENLLCDTCYFEETVECEHCGNRIWNDDNSSSDDMPLCGSCYDDYYTTCEDCGRIIHRDYANYIDDYDNIPYCDSCIDAHRSNSIHDYSYKPNPIFYGDSNRYFGVELEIDDGGKDSDNADELLQIGNRTEERIYIKSDGSLNSGMPKFAPPAAILSRSIAKGSSLAPNLTPPILTYGITAA